jgi:hypothetical protein
MELGGTHFRRLGCGHFQTLPQRVASVTLAEVNAAARKYARPERAFFLLLGDRQKIGTDMRELGMGELKVMQ